MLLKRLSWSLLVAAATCLCPIANAKLIGYDITLEVTQESHSDTCFYPFENLVFRCDVAVGDIFVGHFFVDQTLLTREGDDLVGEIYNFLLPFAGLVYDQNQRWPASAFQGFVGPLVDGGTPLIGAPSPGFDIHAGS